MPTELLATKLFIPPLRPSLVPRPRLIQLLNEGLSLDEAGNGWPRFLAYLTAAFQDVNEEIGAPLLSALQSPQLSAIKTGNSNAPHN